MLIVESLGIDSEEKEPSDALREVLKAALVLL